MKGEKVDYAAAVWSFSESTACAFLSCRATLFAKPIATFVKRLEGWVMESGFPVPGEGAGSRYAAQRAALDAPRAKAPEVV